MVGPDLRDVDVLRSVYQEAPKGVEESQEEDASVQSGSVGGTQVGACQCRFADERSHAAE